MPGSRLHAHMAATVALSLLAIMAIIGGCTLSAPSVTSTTPPQDATDVPVSPAVIQITFDQSMATSSVQNAFSITPAVCGAPPTFCWSEERTLTVTFPQGFAPNTAYTVEIGANAKASSNVAMAKLFVLKFATGPASTAGAGPSEQQSTPAVTFTKDIRPLAEVRCSGCHQGAMMDYDNIIAKKYVVPGKPDESPYYKKPAGLSPHPGGDAWKDKADLVEQWIEAGAPK